MPPHEFSQGRSADRLHRTELSLSFDLRQATRPSIRAKPSRAACKIPQKTSEQVHRSSPAKSLPRKGARRTFPEDESYDPRTHTHTRHTRTPPTLHSSASIDADMLTRQPFTEIPQEEFDNGLQGTVAISGLGGAGSGSEAGRRGRDFEDDAVPSSPYICTSTYIVHVYVDRAHGADGQAAPQQNDPSSRGRFTVTTGTNAGIQNDKKEIISSHGTCFAAVASSFCGTLKLFAEPSWTSPFFLCNT